MEPRAKRYFRDYEPTIVHTPDGSPKKVWRYRGDYYVKQQLPAGGRKRLFAIYVGVSLAALALLVFANSRNVACNRGGVFAAAGLVAMLPAACVVIGSVLGLCAPDKLTRSAYVEQRVLVRACPAIAAVFCLVLAFGFGQNAVRYASTELLDSGVACACVALACIGHGGIALLEWRTPYEILKNEGASKEEGEETDAI